MLSREDILHLGSASPLGLMPPKLGKQIQNSITAPL